MGKVLQAAQIGWGRDRYTEQLERAKKAAAHVQDMVDLVPAAGSPLKAYLETAAKFLVEYAQVRSEADGVAVNKLIEMLESTASQSTKVVPMFDVVLRLEAIANSVAPEVSDPKPGHIHIAGLSEAGFSRRPHHYVLGLNESVFPGATVQDPILTDEERKSLHPELAKAAQRSAERAFQFGEMLARIRGNLCLSYSGLDVAENSRVFRNISSSHSEWMQIRRGEFRNRSRSSFPAATGSSRGDESIASIACKSRMGGLCGITKPGARGISSGTVLLMEGDSFNMFSMRSQPSRSCASPDEAIRQRAREALAQMGQSFIGTIHAFCARMLRERPVEANLDPEFKELEESESSQLIDQYWQDYINDAYLKNNQDLARLKSLGIEAGDLCEFYKTLCLFRDVMPHAPVSPKPDLKKARKDLDSFMKKIDKAMPGAAGGFSDPHMAAGCSRRHRAGARGEADPLWSDRIKGRIFRLGFHGWQGKCILESGERQAPLCSGYPGEATARDHGCSRNQARNESVGETPGFGAA